MEALQYMLSPPAAYLHDAERWMFNPIPYILLMLQNCSAHTLEALLQTRFDVSARLLCWEHCHTNYKLLYATIEDTKHSDMK